MKTANFSFYQGGIKVITPSENNFTLQRLNAAVRSSYYVEKVKAIRAGDKAIKSTLDYVTAAGTFTTRSNANLIERSGVFSLDFDHVTELRVLKADLITKLTPALFFESPGGHGLKVFYYIDVNSGSHADYFKAFQNYFRLEMNLEIDKQCSDVSRACFLSWDCNSYLNENSQLLGKDFLDKYLPKEITEIQTPQPPKPKMVQTSENQLSNFEQCEVIKKNIDKTESFVNGNRNHYCGLLCAGLNRIGIDSNTAFNYLVQFEQSDFTSSEIQKIVECSYKQTNLHGCNPITSVKNQSKTIAPKENPFPMDGMPTVLSDLINDSAAVYGSPKEFFATALLIACGAAVQKRAILNDGKYKNYPQLWAMIVAPSGIGKSEPLKIAFKRLREFNTAHYQTYKQEMREWKIESAACKKEKNAEPEKPILKQILIDDATPEALYPALENNAGLTLNRDELAGWFCDFGRYAKSGEVERYISIHSNVSFTVLRKNSDPLNVEDPYYSIIGGIQPEILEETMQDNKMRKNGFAQRFIFCFPNAVLKPKYNNTIPNELFRTNYDDLIDYLHNTDFGTFRFSDEAKNMFIKFSDANGDKVDESEFDYLKSMYSKFDIHVSRIALTLELIKTFPYATKNRIISAETMAYAIELSNYFIECGLKVERLGSSIKEQSNTLNNATVAKYLVEKCGHSQNKAAEIVGVSQPYVNKIMKKTL